MHILQSYDIYILEAPEPGREPVIARNQESEKPAVKSSASFEEEKLEDPVIRLISS